MIGDVADLIGAATLEDGDSGVCDQCTEICVCIRSFVVLLDVNFCGIRAVRRLDNNIRRVANDNMQVNDIAINRCFLARDPVSVIARIRIRIELFRTVLYFRKYADLAVNKARRKCAVVDNKTQPRLAVAL